MSHDWHASGSDLFEDVVAAITSRLRDLSVGFAESTDDDPVVRDHHVSQAAALLIKPDLLPSQLQQRLQQSMGTGPRVRAEVFLSYSSQDEAWAKEFDADLRNEGLTTFMAQRSIGAGADWDEEIWNAIRQCSAFLALLTTNALGSDWCQFEAGAARGLNKPVYPVLRHVSAERLPDALRQFQARQVQSRQQQFDLIGELKHAIRPPA